MAIPRILTIAGSDSSGGAGVQADIKTVTALGGYAMSAVTALTVQNTQQIHQIEALAPALVADQIITCLEDIGADAIKIGMIANAEIACAIGEALRPYGFIPIILDPVLAASSGDLLTDDAGRAHLVTSLIPMAHLITPNLVEAAELLNTPIKTIKDQEEAAKSLALLGVRHVLVKGGHMLTEDGEPSNIITDILYSDNKIHYFQNTRLVSRNTHGTGCTLASAIATHLARGLPMEAACSLSIEYVRKAITHAPGFGAGQGPLNHGHQLESSEFANNL